MSGTRPTSDQSRRNVLKNTAKTAVAGAGLLSAATGTAVAGCSNYDYIYTDAFSYLDYCDKDEDIKVCRSGSSSGWVYWDCCCEHFNQWTGYRAYLGYYLDDVYCPYDPTPSRSIWLSLDEVCDHYSWHWRCCDDANDGSTPLCDGCKD